MNEDVLLTLLREEIKNEKMVEQELLSTDMSTKQIQRILSRFDATIQQLIDIDD